MDQKTIAILQEEVDIIDQQIGLLQSKKESVNNCINAFSDAIVTAPNKEIIHRYEKELKKPTAKKVKSVKLSHSKTPLLFHQAPAPDGKLKFSQALLKIFQSKPDKIFYSNDLVVMMNKAIEEGQVLQPKKDMVSCVSAYLWNFLKRGLLCKVEGGKNTGYKYNGSKSKGGYIKSSALTSYVSPLTSSNNELDNAIIDVIAAAKKITLPNIISKLRLSEDFFAIAKNLNGTLAACVEKSLGALVEKDVLEWNSDNQYELK